MKKLTSIFIIFVLFILSVGTGLIFIQCSGSNDVTSKPAPMVFEDTEDEIKIEEMHAKVFKQLGGYKGTEACYACHQKQYDDISNSYHVHMGRITKDGKIAHNPADAIDVGMNTRWYPFANLDREAEPENHWRLMESIFCAQCHPGGNIQKKHGMDVDCLICHQKSGYRGGMGLGRSSAGVDKNGNIVISDGGRMVALMMAGADAGGNMEELDLSGIAVKAMEGVELRIGKPTPDNCNFCHWRTNAKRGTRYGLFKGKPTDVHYAAEMRCQECHVTQNHQISKGKTLDNIGTPEERGTMTTCFECHGEEPHEGKYADELNTHMERIACETCHIPKTYMAVKQLNWLPGMDIEGMMEKFHWMMPIAKLFGMATTEKMGEQMKEMISVYRSVKKPGFKPVYAWYNPDIICTDIAHPTGNKDDENSRITPFNSVKTIFFDDGKTPGVKENPDGYLNGHPVPKGFVARAGGNGEKDLSLQEMQEWENGKYVSAVIRKPVMYFQQFHSIAPAKQSLKCNDCHTKTNGRLNFAALGYDEDEVESLTEEME